MPDVGLIEACALMLLIALALAAAAGRYGYPWESGVDYFKSLDQDVEKLLQLSRPHQLSCALTLILGLFWLWQILLFLSAIMSGCC